MNGYTFRESNFSVFISALTLNRNQLSKKIISPPEELSFKGRFLLFQVYRNFANLFSKLSVSTIYKDIPVSKFQQKVQC